MNEIGQRPHARAVQELIELSAQVAADASAQVLLYHALISHLTSDEHDVIADAVRGAADARTREILETSSRMVSTHWTCQVDAGGGRALASLFLIPLNVMVSPGQPRAVPFRLPDPRAVARLLQDTGVIAGATALHVSDTVLSLDAVENMNLTQRYRVVRGMCDGLDAHGALEVPFAPAMLPVAERQSQVAPCFLIGLAVGRILTSIPSYYDAPVENNLRFCKNLTEMLTSHLLAQGVAAVVEAFLPDLFPDAVELGSYRGRLNALSLQVGAALGGEDPEDWVALIAAHDDGVIRLSVNRRQGAAPSLTCAWTLTPAEDAGRTLDDLRRVMGEHGIDDIRCLEGKLGAAGGANGLWPTLADVEYRGETLQ